MFCFLQMTAEMQANPCIFLTVHRLKLIIIKNLLINPCKNYLLGTNGLDNDQKIQLHIMYIPQHKKLLKI